MISWSSSQQRLPSLWLHLCFLLPFDGETIYGGMEIRFVVMHPLIKFGAQLETNNLCSYRCLL
jgi:hypothetical protein